MESVEELKLKPTFYGFIRKYIIAFLPVWILAGYLQVKFILGPLLSFLNPALILIGTIFGLKSTQIYKFFDFLTLFSLMFLAFILSWALRSKEGTASTGITILLPFLIQIPKIKKNINLINLINFYSDFFAISAIISSFLVLLSVELYRNSITYSLTGSELRISGGLWRKQEQTIPYNQIGRIVLEQSIFGKIFDYGTLIPVGVADWGSEYYTRGVGTFVDLGKTHPGAFYARTLKEVSRDPLKCLYGIRSPNKVKEKLEKYIAEPYRAEVAQAEYLRKIYEKMSEADESKNNKEKS